MKLNITRREKGAIIMRRPVIMDGRNVLRQAQLPEGTVYMSVGRAQEAE